MGAPKSTKIVTSTFFNAVNLLVICFAKKAEVIENRAGYLIKWKSNLLTKLENLFDKSGSFDEVEPLNPLPQNFQDCLINRECFHADIALVLVATNAISTASTDSILASNFVKIGKLLLLGAFNE